MTCEQRVDQLVNYFENQFPCRNHWLKDASDTWLVRDKFLDKYKPHNVAKRVKEANQVRDFLHWMDVELRRHGAVYLRGDRPIREAANNVPSFRKALSVALDSTRSLSSRIDDDVWAELPGFGRDKNRADRQIARKIVATYFPNETVPIFNTSHLEHFVFVDPLGLDKEAVARALWRKSYSSLSGGERWELFSKMLIDAKAHSRKLAQRDNVYFMQVLYAGPARPPDMSPNPCYLHPDLEINAADDSADDTYAKETGIKRGQPFHDWPEARKVIELRAMELAIEHYRRRGWSVRDVSSIASYDLACTRRGEELRVEVKGKTDDGSKVLLTRNEVTNARQFPNVALFIVSHIKLSESNGRPIASGGRHEEWNPWNVDAGQLDCLQYEYSPST